MNRQDSTASTTATLVDYLRPEINRPDIFENESFIVKNIRGPSSIKSIENKSPYRSLYYTLGVIFVSAFIFLTLVSWADVLRSWYDSMFINEIIEKQLKARIYYAVTITIISVILTVTMIFIWFKTL